MYAPINNKLRKTELMTKLSDLKARALILKHGDPAVEQREVAAKLGLIVIEMKAEDEGETTCPSDPL